MEETDRLSWSEVNRIIQSVPCSDAQLQRIADCAQIDCEARILELADTLTLTAQCWVSMFGCPIEVNAAGGFFAAADRPRPSSPAAGEEEPDGALAFEFTPRPDVPRYDCVLWHLNVPLAAAELERFCQKIRAALNVNGCLILASPVRIGLKPSAEVDAFYAELGALRPMLPQEVAMALEASGFEPLSVEFAPNRQTLARYRMIEGTLSRCPQADAPVHSRWKQEVKLFLKEGGASFFPSTLFVARRWEYVDGS